jgi:hypothetical protein
VTDGAGGHVPLDRTVPIAIASTAKTWSLAVAAISMHLRQMLTGSEVQRVVTDMADKLGSEGCKHRHAWCTCWRRLNACPLNVLKDKVKEVDLLEINRNAFAAARQFIER